MICLYRLTRTFDFLPYVSSEIYSRKYRKLPNTVFNACKNGTDKKDYIEKVWPAKLPLFVYVLTHNVETVK